MRKILIFISLVIVSCSDKPVNMDTQLYELAGKYLTKADFSTIPFYNKRVYYGPAYSLHKNGEKKEQGQFEFGYKTGVWSGYDKKGNLIYKGGYLNGLEDGLWKGYHKNGKLKYEGKYKAGKQTGKWEYYNIKEKLDTEEIYFSCDAKCEEKHWPKACTIEGKIKSSKNIK